VCGQTVNLCETGSIPVRSAKQQTSVHYIIYKITNLINGKIYIGCHKTNNLDDGYMGSGMRLRRSIQKHGISNFKKEIVEQCSSVDEMLKRERELVNEDFLKRDDVYNMTLGGCSWHYVNQSGKNLYGNNGKIGYGGENLDKSRDRIRTPEENERMSRILSERYQSGQIINPFLGKTHTERTKSIIGAKNSITQSGSGNSQFGTKWIHNPNTLESRKLKSSESIPDGWKYGRVTKPKE